MQCQAGFKTSHLKLVTRTFSDNPCWNNDLNQAQSTLKIAVINEMIMRRKLNQRILNSHACLISELLKRRNSLESILSRLKLCLSINAICGKFCNCLKEEIRLNQCDLWAILHPKSRITCRLVHVLRSELTP